MSPDDLSRLMPFLVLAAALCVFMLISIVLRLALIERSWPAIGRVVTARGVKAHVIEQGSGPEVLMVHGAASNIRPGLLPHTCHRSGNYTDSAAGHGHLAGAKTPIEPHC